MKNCKYFYFLLLFFSFMNINCSSKNGRRQEEIIVISDFLNFYFRKILKNNNPIILKSFEDEKINNCALLNEAKLAELGFRNNSSVKYNLDSLKLKFYPKFITKKDIPNYFISRSWDSFRKAHGNKFFILSSPVINKELNRIVISYESYCGDRCGDGEVALYEKTVGGNWKLIKKYCEWIN